jgi:TRAP-type C4-dicarboxylate transport system substrate-binding protein
MRALRIVGLFQNRDESAYVAGRLKESLDAEFLKAGFVNMGYAALGPEVLFTRKPVHDWSELVATPLFVWALDDAMLTQGHALGLKLVPGSLDAATHLYDEKKVDGFISIPTAALAFQWSAQAGYLSPLSFNYRNGCLFFSNRAFDALPLDVQRYVRSASAKLRGRLDDLNARQDDALLGGLFAKQGVKLVPVSERFRLEFFDKARELRSRPGAQVAPRGLIDEVLSWLADYRAQHRLLSD